MKPVFSAMSEYPRLRIPSIEKMLFEPATENSRAPAKGPRIECPACGGDNIAHCPWDNCYLKNFIPESTVPH
jgi:hypothetical protein